MVYILYAVVAMYIYCISIIAYKNSMKSHGPSMDYSSTNLAPSRNNPKIKQPSSGFTVISSIASSLITKEKLTVSIGKLYFLA